MIRTHVLVLMLALTLPACGGRSIPGASKGTTDAQVKPDKMPGDLMNQRDWLIPKLDRGGHPLDRGAPATFCKGPHALEVSKKPFKVSNVASHMGYIGSCCGPGEIIDFNTLTANGASAKISLRIARFINVTLPPSIKLDLSKLPKGWLVSTSCTPSSFCGQSHPTTHAFKGWIEIKSLLGAPAVEVSACVTVHLTPPIKPNDRPVKLWANKVLVNKVCVPGMDQTCNDDPKISSIKGKCNQNSTCTCNAGSKKTPNGKCR